MLSAAFRVVGAVGPGTAGASVADRLRVHIDGFAILIGHAGAAPGDRGRQRAVR